MNYCSSVIYTTPTTVGHMEHQVYYQAEIPQQPNYNKKKNKRTYKQKYLTQWEEDERFRGWITQCRDDTDFAFCLVCNCKILARTSSVTAHHNSSKHKKKLLLVCLYFS